MRKSQRTVWWCTLCTALVAVTQAQGQSATPNPSREHAHALIQAHARLDQIPAFQRARRHQARVQLRLLEAAWERRRQDKATPVVAARAPQPPLEPSPQPSLEALLQGARQEASRRLLASVTPPRVEPPSRSPALDPARQHLYAALQAGAQAKPVEPVAVQEQASAKEQPGVAVAVAPRPVEPVAPAPPEQPPAPASAQEEAPLPSPVQGEGLARYKGELQPPLLYGKVKVPFGTTRSLHSKTLLRHTGWTLTAPSGHRVRNISPGRVVYAGALRGYGLTVVVDHGGAYHSVYGHMRVLLVKVGDEIKQGDPLGVLGASGSIGGERLYFELRHRGRPVDPEGWFAPPGRFR